MEPRGSIAGITSAMDHVACNWLQAAYLWLPLPLQAAVGMGLGVGLAIAGTKVIYELGKWLSD